MNEPGHPADRPETPPGAAHHIVVVEDDAVTRAKLVGYFTTQGYRVSEAASADEMRAILAREPADLLMIDINLPGEDGLTLTREQRARSDIGIILVSGRTDDVDRIVGLEMGADDYVTKPFNQRELLVRVKNLLRRTAASAVGSTAAPPERNLVTFDGWTLDLLRRRLTDASQDTVSLTRAEFELLAAFVRHPGEVMARERLMSLVTHRSWEPDDRTIDVLVRRLRGKIEADPKTPALIVTAHGEGYVFAAAVNWG